jgi:hypothetical protein
MILILMGSQQVHPKVSGFRVLSESGSAFEWRL